MSAGMALATRPSVLLSASGVTWLSPSADHRAPPRDDGADHDRGRAGLPSGWLILATVAGGTLAGGASIASMYVDRDIDRIMKRTRHRPLVTGVVSPRNALVFAVALEVVAFVQLWALVNLLSAVLAVSATLFYVFVYTS